MTMTSPADPAPSAMRAKVIEEYATLMRIHEAQGPILEIPHGARRQAALTLAPPFAGQERHVVSRGEGGEVDGVQFHKGEPNDLAPLFDDQCFSTVIWDRALDQDARFWMTLAEIKRVLLPGGVLMVCTRGFAKANKFGVKATSAKGSDLPFMTATGAVGVGAPDFWRLSPQAMRNVILGDFDVREVRMSFMVPHVFGVGVKRR